MTNEARKQQILALWAKGLSATEIGVRLMCSRSAILGVIYRARKKGETAAPRPLASKACIGKMPAKKQKTAAPSRIQPQEAEQAASAPIIVSVAPPGGVRMEALRLSTCRWPLWGNAEKPALGTHRFCGAQCEGTRTYCAEHCKVAYVGKPTRAKKRKRISLIAGVAR